MGKSSEVNVWCRHYDRCLEAAVERGKRFDCGKCRFRHDRGGKREVLDMLPYYLLLAAIFQPEAYRRYWQEKRMEEIEHFIEERRKSFLGGIESCREYPSMRDVQGSPHRARR